MISNVNSIQCKLNSAAGAAVMIELRMRLIGEHSQQVRDELIKLVVESKKEASDKYWDCDLSFLDDAIIEVFYNQLDNHELQKLDRFRKLRNKLLHTDFVALMDLLGISPTGRHILNPISCKKNLLVSANIKEAILSADRNRCFDTMEREANEVLPILDKLLHCLAIQ